MEEEKPPSRSSRAPAGWDALSASDREGMLLATEARTLGSQGEKHGNDVGVVLVAPTNAGDETITMGGRDAWRVLAWGCARTLELRRPPPPPPLPSPRRSSEGEAAAEVSAANRHRHAEVAGAAEDGGGGDGGTLRKRQKKAKGSSADNKIDLHAEADAVCYAARRGIALEGATAFITRSPCNRCLPLLIAAGVTRVVHGDAIARHTTAESAERQLKIAEDAGVELVEDAPAVPREAARYRDWLEGKGRLCLRPDVNNLRVSSAAAAAAETAATIFED